MTIAENFTETTRRETGSDTLRQDRAPAVLCLTIASFEGLSVSLLFVSSVIFYHFALLETPSANLAWPLYIAATIILGSVYAGFSATAAARFLHGNRQPEVTLPFTFFSWTIAFASMLMVAFLTGTIGDLSRVSLTTAYILGISLVIAMRSFVNVILSRQIARGELRFQKIAIIGERANVVKYLLESDLWRHGQVLTGALYLEDITKNGAIKSGAVATFANNATLQGAEHIIIAGDVSKITELNLLVAELKRFSMNVVFALVAGKERLKFHDVVPIGPNNTLRVLRKPLGALSLLLKRSLDLIGAITGLVLLSPVLLIIAVFIKLDSPGPIIYKQARRGFNGAPFMIFKFRSMRVTEPGNAVRQAERGDKRVTRIGRFIRATSIDELPQLINVIIGEMSLVGPRPHALSHDDELGQKMADYAYRQRIKPGITGWAQVNGYRGETVTLEQMQGRTLYDLHYIDNWSIFSDLWVILLTVFSPKTRQNAF